MSTQKHFDDITYFGQGMSPDSLQVLDEATLKMREWIDKGVESLKTDMKAKAQEAVVALEQERLLASDAFDAMDLNLKKVEQELKDQLRAVIADNQQLLQASKAIDTAVKSAKDDLEARKQKWELIGKKVSQTAISAVSKAFGAPV
jgi:hypothetical protein